jgi:hypothetical protein
MSNTRAAISADNLIKGASSTHTNLKNPKNGHPSPGCLDGLSKSAYVAQQELAGYRMLGRIAACLRDVLGR